MTQKRQFKIKPLCIVLVLLAAALLAAWPFLGGGVYHGSDLGYHLRRIENIAIGLANRQFPVRIESDWLSGYGYAVGVFYGDILLYFPALLRLLGLPVTWCYGLYLFAVNALTALGGYCCVKRLGGQRSVALCFAVLYTLSAYRLCNATTRAALGEYTAMAFLPLVACGFWQCLVPPAKKYRIPAWALLVLGLSGVLQSHLLSFEMTVALLVLAALVLARYTFQKAALARVLGAAGVFCALNAGFLVPLLDYYFTGKFQINQPGGTEAIQQNGALWGQLLGLDYLATGAQQADLVQNMALTPGTALLLGGLLALGAAVYAFVRRKKGGLAVLALCAAGASALVLSSNTFPWDALYGLGRAAQNLIGSLQFPWRFLGPATLFLALAACGGLALLPGKKWRTALALALCAVAFAGGVRQMVQYTRTAAPETYFYGTEEPFWEKTCGHYLPAGNGPVDLNDLPTGPIWGGGIELTAYAKNGTTATFTAQNTAGEMAEVRLPLLYYKGYRASTAAGALPVVCGENNTVTVQLPDGFHGEVTVQFSEPWVWRGAEAVSLLTALTLLTLGALALRRRHPASE